MMASSSGVPETLQAEADDLLQQARDRRKMEEKKKKRRSKSADRWRRRLQSALVTAEQLPTASASVPRQVQLPAAANLVASSKNRTIVVPHITSDQDVVIKEREHKKKAATICFQDVTSQLRLAREALKASREKMDGLEVEKARYKNERDELSSRLGTSEKEVTQLRREMEALLSDRRAVQELGHKTLRQKLRQVAKEVEGLDARRQEAERSAKEANAQLVQLQKDNEIEHQELHSEVVDLRQALSNAQNETRKQEDQFARQRRQLERAAEETSRPIFTDASAQNLYQEKRKLEKKVLAVQSERDEARRRASMFEDRTAISEMALDKSRKQVAKLQYEVQGQKHRVDDLKERLSQAGVVFGDLRKEMSEAFGVSGISPRSDAETKLPSPSPPGVLLPSPSPVDAVSGSGSEDFARNHAEMMRDSLDDVVWDKENVSTNNNITINKPDEPSAVKNRKVYWTREPVSDTDFEGEESQRPMRDVLRISVDRSI